MHAQALKTAVIGTIFALVFVPGSTLGLSGNFASERIAPEIELPPAVLDQVKNLSLAAAPPAPLASLGVELSTPSGSRRADIHFERLSNGLWGVALIVPIAKGANVMRAVTLQGMVTLGQTLELYNEVQMVVPIPAKGYLPLVLVKSSIRTSSLRKSQSVSGDFEALLSPRDARKFKYSTVFEVQTIGRGSLTTSTASSKHDLSVECSASTARPASMIYSKLKGMAIGVACEATRNGQSDGVQHYEYLVESQIYVLASATDAQRNTTGYKITDVAYANETETK